MIPKFLQAEVFPLASITIVPATAYLLHVRHPSGVTQTLAFASVLARNAALVGLGKQPVDLRLSEVDDTISDVERTIENAERGAPDDPDDRDEDRGSTCGAACGYCGGCS